MNILFLSGPVLIAISLIQGQTFLTGNFDDGSMGPFHMCTTQNPNYAKVVDGHVETYWVPSSHRAGGRMTAGAEFCSSWKTVKEGWYGLKFRLGAEFPQNTFGAVCQIFQNTDGNSGCSSWAAIMGIQNNNLYINHRAACGDPTHGELYPNLPRNVWFNVVLHYIASRHNAGLMEIWVNGEQKYRKTGINFGFNSWSGDSLGAGSPLTHKAGQYNWVDVNQFTTPWVIQYDDISMYNAPDGYAKVDPSKPISGLKQKDPGKAESIGPVFVTSPTSDRINVDMGKDFPGGAEIRIFSPRGESMIAVKATSRFHSLSLHGISPGLYFMTFRAGTRVVKSKLIKS